MILPKIVIKRVYYVNYPLAIMLPQLPQLLPPPKRS